MLSNKLSHLEKIIKADMDKELLRSGISSEMEAINLYEQMHAFAENKDIKKLILEIIEEGKSRVGRLQAMLLINDQGQKIKLEEGAKKIQEMLSVHQSISKLPEEKKSEKKLVPQKDGTPHKEEPAIVKKVDTDQPETKNGSIAKMKQETGEALSAREAVSKLPEEKKPGKQLSINKDEISEVKEPEIEKGTDINPPETKESSTKMKHEAVEMMLCGVCNHKVKVSGPIRCPLCGAPSGRMKRI